MGSGQRTTIKAGWAAAGLIAVAPLAHADGTVPAYTRQGVVVGTSTASGDVFRGVPYARPPLGALRFAYPQPPPSRPGPLDATRTAPACPQPPNGFTATPVTSENCLTLDIYRPRHLVGRLPVMVWFYGGGFTIGASSQYDASALAETAGVIVAVVNYRIGALGFLAASGLAAANGGHAGNYGIADQTRALDWLRTNIGFFAGDPGSVTISGESAGGASVCAQMVAPAAKGLFAAAISQSGFCGTRVRTLAQAEPASDAFVAKVGCSTAADVPACLRGLPVATIVAAGPQSALGGASSLGPIVDGSVLPLQFNEAVDSNRFNHVPAIIGSNHDEGTLFVAAQTLFAGRPVTAGGYPVLLRGLFGPDAAISVEALYPLSRYQSPTQAYAAVFGDSQLICPVSRSVVELSTRVQTYAYEYNAENPPLAAEGLSNLPGFDFGDAHGLDVGYLFPAAVPASAKDAQFDRLSAVIMRDWGAFAHYRTPNVFAPGSDLWFPYVARFDDVQSLRNDPQLEFDFRAVHRCAFWDSLPTPSGI